MVGSSVYIEVNFLSFTRSHAICHDVKCTRMKKVLYVNLGVLLLRNEVDWFFAVYTYH